MGAGGMVSERRKMAGSYGETFARIGTMHFSRRSRHEARFIYREIFDDRTYLRHGLALSPGDTVIDAGANVGFFSVFAHAECAGDLTLVAFEPIPETFRNLEKNLKARTGQKVRLHLLNKGLTRIGGPKEAAFTYFPSLPGNSTQHFTEKAKGHAHLRAVLSSPRRYFGAVRRHSGRAAAVTLPLALLLYPIASLLGRAILGRAFSHPVQVNSELSTLSEAIASFGLEHIDLLKIDVEGAELDILDGLTARDWPRIRQVAMEVQDWDDRLTKVIARLEEAGFAMIHAQEITAPWGRLGRPIHMVYARR